MNVVKKLVKELVLHPQNDFPPDNSGTEWDAFVANIQKYGLRHPITIDKKNRIVSGQRRWLAHKELGLQYIDCIVENYKTEKDARYAVIDLNLHTRHLTDKQRATLFEERYGKQLTHLIKSGLSPSQAARKLGIDAKKNQDRVVRIYNKILKKEFASMKSEQAVAKALAHLPEQKRARILKLRDKAIRDKAKFQLHLSNYQETCKVIAQEVKLFTVGLPSLVQKNVVKGRTPDAIGLNRVVVEERL